MLSWKENLTPISDEFGDIYFSPENGLEETKHVFIKGNDLITRWENLGPQSSFSILELGFGTGLNFLTTWKEYSKFQERFRLHYISIEKFPLSKEEISKAMSVFPELNEFKNEFLKSYQDLIPGMNYFRFQEGKIHLTLFLGDVKDALCEISGKVDAIYLDGFAPSKNPEMWEEFVFQNIRNVAKPGTTVSTFTVARMVRDSLTSAGFTLEKKPGFGRKREMLTGTFPDSFLETDKSVPKDKPWCKRSFGKTKIRTAAIIGAGIAGSSLANSLSKRGIEVVLLDPSGVANETSGIPGAISHPHLTKLPSPTSLFTLRAFRYALQFLSSFAQTNEFGISGLFHAITAEMSGERFQKSLENHLLSAEIVSRKSTDLAYNDKDRIDPRQEGVFFPRGFWTHPSSIAKRLAEQPGIQMILETVTNVQNDKTQWNLLLKESERTIHSDSVIFCNSYSMEELLTPILGRELFPIRKVRGQLIKLKETPVSSRFKNILCAEHYLTPSIDGEHILGSTFDEFDSDSEPRKKDTDQLFQFVRERYPDMKWNRDDIVSEQVGFRAQTPDRFPVIGPICDPLEFCKEYRGIGLPKNRGKTYSNVKTIPGLYVFGGLGSRGILSSFLGAEILASLILDEPVPIESSLLESLHPSRFLYRKIRSLD
ncbi:bifunctional tRNA (5-methylaminomethyl-2-thiouridine)(34)-methyltransferase MnmD/FAD-dependent 5-carboxymethylaminomethyl-2-thiouridine(34) oxidoreductase MnmC [Leptospira sp. WS92.C1]